jgi:hypothetical protein
MTRTPNDRDRLALAFAELNSHGILAYTALPTTVERGHALLRAELAARYPHGLGSYVFFTQADEQQFDPAGHLTVALPLHCSNQEVATAVEAACAGARVDPRLIDRIAMSHVAPAGPRRAEVPTPAAAARHRAAPSPWRWLGPRRPVTAG